MRIDVEIDCKELFLRMEKGQKKLAYATVNAINSTAKRVQQAARDHLEQVFELRKRDFMLRQAAVIKPFAQVRSARPYAEIAPGRPPRLLLGLFERGGERPPFIGKRVAVPIRGSAARPTFSSAVPPEFWITKLRMHPVLTRPERQMRRQLRGVTTAETRSMRSAFEAERGKGRIWKGAQRTYMIPDFGIFRRVGPGKRDTEMIYFFDSEVRVQAVLEFLKTAQGVSDTWFKEEVERELVKALAHEAAKGK